MKFFIDNWFLFFTALVSGGLLLWPKLAGGGAVGKIGVAEAVRLINREKAVLIDVSDPAEYAAAHAAGAKSVPLATLETSGDLPKNKTLPVVLLCSSGARASRAAGMLKKLGFEKTHVLGGGLPAWRDANMPIEKTA